MFINCHYCFYPSGASIDCAEMVSVLFSSPVEVQVGVRTHTSRAVVTLHCHPVVKAVSVTGTGPALWQLVNMDWCI